MATRDPRKAALAAKQTPSVTPAGATPTQRRPAAAAAFSTASATLNFAAFPPAPASLPAAAGQDQQPGSKHEPGAGESGIAMDTTPTKQHTVALAAPAPALNFATFPTVPGGGPDPLPSGEGPRATVEDGDDSAAALGVPADGALAAVTPSDTNGVEEPAGGKPTTISSGLTPSPAAKASAVVTTPTKAPGADSYAMSANSWANFGENRRGTGGGGGGGGVGLERRFSDLRVSGAALATPTNSDVSSVATPSASCSAFGEDIPAVPAAGTSITGAGSGTLPSEREGGGKEQGVAPRVEDLSAPSVGRSEVPEVPSAETVKAQAAATGAGPAKDAVAQAETTGPEVTATSAPPREGEHLSALSVGCVDVPVPEAPDAETVTVQATIGVGPTDNNAAVDAETTGAEVNGTGSSLQPPASSGDANSDVAARAAPSAGGTELGASIPSHEVGAAQAESRAAVPQVHVDQIEAPKVTPSEPAEEAKVHPPSASKSPDLQTGDSVSEAIATSAASEADVAAETDPASVKEEQTQLNEQHQKNTRPGKSGERVAEPPPAAGLSGPAPSKNFSPVAEERTMPGASDDGGGGSGSEDVKESVRPSGGTVDDDGETSTCDNPSGTTPDAVKTTTAVVKIIENVETGDASTRGSGGVADDAVVVPPKAPSTAVKSTDPSEVGGIETPSMPSTTQTESTERGTAQSARPASVDWTKKQLTPITSSVEDSSAMPLSPNVAAAVPAASTAALATSSASGPVQSKTAARSVVLAAPASVFTIAEVAEAHARSPVLGSSGTVIAMASSQAERATVAVVDLWNGGATTR